MPRRVFLLLAFLSASLLAGCATQRPVLYPNEHLKQGGNEKAQADIDACMRLANESGAKSSVDERIGKQTAGGAVVGGVSGAVLGSFWGALGRGGLIGAAAGAAGGLTRGLIQADQPDALLRNFVNRCLREKGYEPIGWK